MPEASPQMIEQMTVSVQQALRHIAMLASVLPPDVAGLSPRAMAERLYSERRQRDGYFPAGLFGEPAWDLLLALFIAEQEGREVSIAEAFRVAGVGAAAGRRLLAKVESAGLVFRIPGREDRRRQCVELTQDGIDRLSDYLAGLV